ncbi:IS3 family transposase [Limosilactobacillus fermentum]
MRRKETYGYRRIWYCLMKQGFTYCQETVRRLMTSMGLKVTLYSSKSHYHSYRGHVVKTAPNYLHQQFNARKAYQFLHTDITQISISENVKGYLSLVIDEASGAVVAYATSTHPNMNLITTMLVSLFKNLPQGSSPIMHSDQGWQYQQWQYRGLLCQHGITQSMSRKGNCLDNSPVESFFNLLKRECLNRVKITSFQQFQNVIDQYIHWYNNIRISVNKKGMTPNEYIRYHSNL